MIEDKRPLILVSNDDSISAPGLRRLIDCVKPLGQVVAVAPLHPQSGKSSAITVNTPLRVKLEETYGTTPIYSVSGSPVDCVKLALHAVLDGRRPAMVVSGINHGANSGNSIIYSGTMGAVIEATMCGIPAVGFSLLSHSLDADFTHALPYVREISRRVLENGLPKWVCLNVNFPAEREIAGLKVCRAARGYWTDEYQQYLDPQGNPFYWLTGRYHNQEPGNPDTDEYWLERGWASVVPACPDLSVTPQIDAIGQLLSLDAAV